jgi:aminoglycoside 6'-N-acetyltransferase
MIETKRLRLRPFTEVDLPALLSYRRDPEVARYQGWSADFSEVNARRFIEAVSTTRLGEPGRWSNLALELLATGEVVGDVGLRAEPDEPRGQIGFTLARAHQRRGYALEAGAALCEHALRNIGLGSLFAVVDSRNGPSIRLLERLGFRPAGFHERGAWFKGELCDDLLFERAAAGGQVTSSGTNQSTSSTGTTPGRPPARR